MKIVGHRGAMGLAPENTLVSIRKALEHQVDQVEFDVRVTHDSVPVLLHDPHLTDAAGNSLLIADHSFTELQSHKPDLATLEEALSCINAAAVPYIEVKPAEPAAPIVAIIRQFLEAGTYKPQGLLLGSKSQKTLRELHAELPEIPTIVIESWSGVRAHWRARQVGTKRIAMNQRWLWRGFIGPVARRGWELYPYTLNDPAKAKRWARWGIAGVVTNYPDRFEE